jgi:hypothetical protein
MMADIYSLATNVCIWLGEQAADSQLALDFIQNQFAKLGTFDEIVREEGYKPHWKALAALMSRPWFSRRWVVQEVSLARFATVHCEDAQVD